MGELANEAADWPASEAAAGGTGRFVGELSMPERVRLGSGGDTERIMPSSSNARRSELPSKFLQLRHLQLSEHRMFAYRHIGQQINKVKEQST